MYKSVFFIVAIISFVLGVGCNTTSSEDDNVIKSVDINISFVNEAGDDLLDPDHPNAISEQNTDLYYLVDGEKEKVYDENLDYPKHFFISDEKLSGRYFMRVFPHIDQDQRKATTYIEFNAASMDTIKVEYEIGDNSTVVTKVWYNDELRWDVNGESNNEENIENVSRYIVVTRDVE